LVFPVASHLGIDSGYSGLAFRFRVFRDAYAIDGDVLNASRKRRQGIGNRFSEGIILVNSSQESVVESGTARTHIANGLGSLQPIADS